MRNLARIPAAGGTTRGDDDVSAESGGGAVGVIADVLRKHRSRGTRVIDNGPLESDGYTYALRCQCGDDFREGTGARAAVAHEAHQAAEVDAALGRLTRETVTYGTGGITGMSYSTGKATASRWVSGWVREPAEENPDV